MPKSSTQSFLEIDQIREGVIVLKNKALRGIMAVSSLNFALKSDEEQSAIIFQFQEFLNSLDFSCQIIIQSKKLNITGYLETVEKLAKRQENELLQAQTKGYHDFIEELVAEGDIMDKKFFVVVPFTLFEAKKSSGAGVLSFLKSPKVPSLTQEIFQRSKKQLWQRMEFVASGLKRCGNLQAIPLTTSEIIELLWGLHHPKQAEMGYYPEILPELSK